jgi:hypothetical protein
MTLFLSIYILYFDMHPWSIDLFMPLVLEEFIYKSKEVSIGSNTNKIMIPFTTIYMSTIMKVELCINFKTLAQ